MAVLVVLTVAMETAPARASCAPRSTIEENLARAELVFVGTVVEVTNSDRWARFAVEDTWKGQVDGHRVEIRGGAREGYAMSNDRKYVRGTRYLVFALAPPTEPRMLALYGDGVRFTDNGCSLTQAYTESLAETRPTTARPPAAAPPQEPPVEAASPTTDASTKVRGGDGHRSRGHPFVVVVGVAAVAGMAVIGIRRYQAVH